MRPVPGRRFVVSAVAIAAALAAGYGVATGLEIGTGGDASFYRDGTVGDEVGMEYADVRLVEARPAAQLATDPDFPSFLQADDVWVVVRFSVTPLREPTLFSTTRLVDTDDRAYAASVRSGCPGPEPVPTLVTLHTAACFDVPADRLEGLRLEIARGSDLNDGLRRDEVARFDLGLDASTAREWAGSDATYLVPSSGFDPFSLVTVDPGGAGS